jgi:predicted ribosome quality control (RQC) complex YloA/Tae2 family protein
VVFRAADGRPSGVWAFPAFQPGWTHATPAASLSVACESYFGHAEVHAGTEALRKTVAGALKKTLRTCRLQLAEARESIESLGRTELFRISGELLAASAGRVEPGATVVELPNWYDEDQTPLRIELDPELDARGNSARYFHRYRRAMAGAETALERIPELEARELRLTAQLESAACAEASELRAMIEAEPRLFAAPTGEPGRREPAAEREFPVGVRVRRVSVDGWEILYGENAVSNDWLTTRHARPHDLWLHARAVTGAHVIIRDARTVERVPSAVLREAARLAAAHSEAKHSALVPVDYTFRRYVRKPRGSGPGRVTYTQERTLDIDPRR